MTCKDCIHYDICYNRITDGEENLKDVDCPEFKDKSKIIEIPCKLFDKLYYPIFNGKKWVVDKGSVCSFSYEDNKLWMFARYENGLTYWHIVSEIGKKVFLTAEEAEKALEEVL